MVYYDRLDTCDQGVGIVLIFGLTNMHTEESMPTEVPYWERCAVASFLVAVEELHLSYYVGALGDTYIYIERERGFRVHGFSLSCCIGVIILSTRHTH